MTNKEVLNEGLTDKLKSGWENTKGKLAKLGRVQKGGKFLGRNDREKAALTQMQGILNKDANRLLKVFVQEFEKEYPGFPNIKDRNKFKEAVGDPKGGTEAGAIQGGIYAFYNGIVEMTQLDPNDKAYLDPVAANAIIKGLRQYVEKLIDYDLAQVYQYMEVRDANGNIITEAEPEQQGDDEGPLKGDQKTGTEKVLKSNKLPAVLGSLGILTGGIGWLFQTEWFQQFFKTEEITEKFVEKATATAKVKFGDGLTQTMEALNPSMNWGTVGDVKKNIAELGGGNLDKGLEQLKSIMLPANKVNMSIDDQVKVLKEMLVTGDPNSPISNVFGKNTNFFKETAQKVLGRVINTTNAYGNTPGMPFASNLGAILTAVKVVRIVIRTGGSTAVGIGLGMASWPLMILGGTAAATAAILKGLRKHGQKISRFADLNNLLKSLVYIEENNVKIPDDTEGKPNTKEAGGNTGGAAFGKKEMQLYDALKQFFKFVYNNKKLYQPSSNLGQENQGMAGGAGINDRAAAIEANLRKNDNTLEKDDQYVKEYTRKYATYVTSDKDKMAFSKHITNYINNNIPELKGQQFDARTSPIKYKDFVELVKSYTPAQGTDQNAGNTSYKERGAMLVTNLKRHNPEFKKDPQVGGYALKYLQLMDRDKKNFTNAMKKVVGNADPFKDKINYNKFKSAIDTYTSKNTPANESISTDELRNIIMEILLNEAAFVNLKIEPKEVREALMNRNVGDRNINLGKDMVIIYEQAISRLQHIVFLIAEVNALLKQKVDSGNASALDKQFIKNVNEVLSATKNIKGGFRSLYAVDDPNNRLEVANLAFHIKNFFKVLYNDKAYKDMSLSALVQKYKLHEQVMGRLDENTQDDRANIVKLLPKIFGGLYIIFAYMRSQMNKPADEEAKKKEMKNAMKPNAFAETPEQKKLRKQGEKAARTGKKPQQANSNNQEEPQEEEI